LRFGVRQTTIKALDHQDANFDGSKENR
jgi:hypothetical protein